MVTAHTSILVLLQVDTATPLPLLVAQMPWSDCCEGELGEVLEYLRKSKYLSLPGFQKLWNISGDMPMGPNVLQMLPICCFTFDTVALYSQRLQPMGKMHEAFVCL